MTGWRVHSTARGRLSLGGRDWLGQEAAQGPAAGFGGNPECGLLGKVGKEPPETMEKPLLGSWRH